MIYLDTSVPSAYYDDNKPERQEFTVEFWKRLPSSGVLISDLTYRELKEHPDADKRKKVLQLVRPFKKLKASGKSDLLLEKYLAFGLFKPKDIDDATHLAIASAYRIKFIVSWNFRHLVNTKTRNLAKLINVNAGFTEIEIIAPPEF